MNEAAFGSYCFFFYYYIHPLKKRNNHRLITDGGTRASFLNSFFFCFSVEIFAVLHHGVPLESEKDTLNYTTHSFKAAVNDCITILNTLQQQKKKQW